VKLGINVVVDIVILSVISFLDVLFIGPYDLSIGLGYTPPNPDPHPEVEKVIQQVLQDAHAAGKKWYVDFPSHCTQCTIIPRIAFEMPT
jgi:2-keto-3-deoxy-L-rhamnonate aldolase RhmA